MAKDHTLPLKNAIVSHLRADSALTALLNEESIFGMRTPVDRPWPFARYGTPDASPRRAQCWDGSDNAITLHVFSKQTFEDETANILAAIVESLGDTVIELGGGEKAYVQSRGSTIIPDAAEANAWHGIARFEATVA